ncbi:MAG: hypothetical protein LC808_03790 [Actinobacteria bacterium]|nr:hypothetical protein [Actinomycetota bacterium]
MRKRAIVASAVALLALTAHTGGATATHSGGGGPDNQDFVHGSVTFSSNTGVGGTLQQTHHQFNARSGPSGEDPTGRWSIKGDFGEARGYVSCLRVTGNRATIGGRYDPDSPVLGNPAGILFQVVDNGRPGTDESTGYFHFAAGALESCNDQRPSRTFQQGNLVVHDATP